MTNLSVTVIICAHTLDRQALVVRAVEGVLAQTHPATEILLVIDHNPALHAALASHWPTAPVRLLENQQPRGLSGARNTAIAAAQSDILAFLDDDALPAPNWLASLLQHFDSNTVAGVGGKINPEWLAGRPKWFPAEFDWVVGCTYLGTPETVAPVRNLIGASMSFRRQVFTDVGGFIHGIGRIGALPVGCEETELCIRYNQHHPHTQFLYDPSITVLHTVPAQRGTFAYFLSRCYHEGRSKALVATLVGSGAALETEKRYTARVLPAGVVRGLSGPLRGDFWGIPRAAAIVIGLGVTGLGYLRGRFELLLARPQKTAPK